MNRLLLLTSNPWVRRIVLPCLLLAAAAVEVLARAGGGHSYSGGGGGFSGGGYSGGGSYSGSSGGGGGLFYLLYYLVVHHPIIGIPACIVVIYFAYAGSSVGHSAYVGRTIVRGTAEEANSEKDSKLGRIKGRDPGFDANGFIQRVSAAFLKIQEAWSGQDMSKARAFISDGVMERFSIQIAMQKVMGLRNDMSDVRVLDARISQVNSDSHFDAIHMAVHATAVDTDVSLADGKIVRNPAKKAEEFMEVWSFLRRPGAKTLQKPGLIEGHCPNCGSPLELADAAKCGSCDSLVNSGEYDWVLAEITQASEWTVRQPGTAVPGFSHMQVKDPALNIQFLEDRCSVAFWHWQMAHWEPKADSLRGVATDDCCKNFFSELSQKRMLYKNAAVGGVEVLACETGVPMDRAHIQVRWSGEKFEAEGDRYESRGQVLRCHVFILSRSTGALTDAKSGLRSLTCSGCGAPPSGRSLAACEYCSAPFNDGRTQWTVSAVMPRMLWQRPPVPPPSSPAAATPEEAEWSALLAPGQAMAVLVGAMAMDGKIDPREMAFAQAYAKKNNIPDENVQRMVQAARIGQLQIPRPKTPQEVQAYLKGLIKMSLADGTVSAAEMKSLVAFGSHLNVPQERVQQLVKEERAAMYARAKDALKNR